MKLSNRIFNSQTAWVTLFAVAMGLLECVVVVYMRLLYYPHGFSFPLAPMEPYVIGVELLREFATLVMLLAIGMIAGRSSAGRMAWFVYAFAIWDLFYYVFLKVLLGWPESLLTWDLLFLIPVTWVGPVIAPVINSLCMILLAVVILTGKISRLKVTEWLLLVAGSVVVIVAYTEVYLQHMLSRFTPAELFDVSRSRELIEYGCALIPGGFPWLLFAAGVAVHLAAILMIWRRKAVTRGIGNPQGQGQRLPLR